MLQNCIVNFNNAHEFKENSRLPFEVCAIHLREEGKTETLLEENMAKWHHFCHQLLNNSQLARQRGKGQKEGMW